ncbi:hypothetical protein BDY24DRAFT_381549 [Mrakia frigida]|uniref:uncharacterized protein n=1 Tax=Mrakia frigida TaxID=29902 RepID=UPI003FCC174D
MSSPILDPLRMFFSHSSASSSKEDVSNLALLPAALDLSILPPQIQTVLHQTTAIPFPGLDRDLRLSIDASPGCGGVVWPAGEIMCRYFLHLISLEPDLFAGKTVLELGAGTGLVALVLGLKERRCKIYCTDQQ